MTLRPVALLFAALATAGVLLDAQSPATQASGYLTPPQAIVDIMTAEPLPTVTVSPANDVIALMTRASMPSIEEISQPMLRLGGIRINPRNNGPHRATTGTGLTLRVIATGAERRIALPAGARIGNVRFSPDGRRLSFTNTRERGIDLYIADVATGQARLVQGASVNGLVNACDWLDDSSAILCALVPPARGAAPAAPKAPPGPNIQENQGNPGPVRTYQDLLTSAHDEALFEHYMQAQLAFVDGATARVVNVGKPGTITGASASPDGRFVLVTRMKRPYSRLLPYSQFPSDVEIWSRAGEKVRTVADVPMGDTIPINGVITGPRSYRWVPVQPATLMWVEALDNGDLRNAVPHRDRILTLAAPFTAEPTEVAKTEFRYGGANWTEKGVILLTENDRRTRTTRTWLLDAAWSQPRKLWDRRQQDQYSHPGTPVFTAGGNTIKQVRDSIYLTGSGASKEGDRPFLDRLNLNTLQVERLFRSDDTSYESVVALVTDDAGKVITRREMRTEPPNYFVRELPGDTKTALTQFKDPHPQITKAMAERMFVTYQRKDGVGLSGTIYLPIGYQKGERVPMLVWAYPREFVDADAASQVTGSPNRFTTVGGSSHLLLLAHGYAIFDGPTMPIVGAGETANDTYVEQLVTSAEAAVNKAVELGITDRNRIGVGGHSYGAFMTANLLAHSDLFAAGIARSGAYNRTLTPFGFQAETRTYWEVPEVYLKMSPFNYAHKINEPILLIHGEADDNSGTFPIQSERLYMALKGHGATVRYVTLPHEAHGYVARESNMHVVAETINWLDRYVKNAGRKTTSTR
ncbi:MAG TPA: prolyl oligopeptidase family serine peptidase [Vicinamibacterales bacterium]|nr:prolyl oligopeptidase family serine peptidase [Vicinamibacterales bacterium]